MMPYCAFWGCSKVSDTHIRIPGYGPIYICKKHTDKLVKRTGAVKEDEL